MIYSAHRAFQNIRVPILPLMSGFLKTRKIYLVGGINLEIGQILKDFIAALGVVINGLPQGILALSFSFASIPTALAFMVGAVGNGIVGSVAPISFQAETITLAGTMGKNMRERLTMIFLGAFGMALIGAFGLMSGIVGFIGDDITSAMMAGVGIMLVKVSVDMFRKSSLIGATSLAAAILTYIFTKDLVYTIIISVVLSSLVAAFSKNTKDTIKVEESRKFTLTKFTLNAGVIRGALAMICLNIGANISFGMITGSMAGGETNPANIDHLSVISSLADMASSAFGGGPVEAIISATGSAPHPVWSGVIMMVIMAAILISGLLPKIAKFVPSESIAGFLFVLGCFVTVPINASAALAASPMTGGVTMTVTALFDPFVGMISGIIIKMILPLIGVTL